MNRKEWSDNLTRLGLDSERDFREEQFKGASAVDAVFASATPTQPRSLLLEAPTGIGKTLMYLGALSTRDRQVRAAVSTSGKLLQQQVAATASKLGMESVVLMGRANYLCKTACCHYLDTMPEDHPLRGELEKLCQWLGVADNHEMREILKLEEWSREFLDFMRHHLTASSAYCQNGHEGNTQGFCYFSALEAKAAENPLVILNHHALFSFGKNKLFHGRVLVADEAHAMPEAASSVFTRAVSTRQLFALRARAEQCREVCPKEVDAFQHMLEEFASALRDEVKGDDIVVPVAKDWEIFNFLFIDSLKAEPFGDETTRHCDSFHISILKELNASWHEVYDFVTKITPNGNGVLYFESDAAGEVSLKYAPIETASLLTDFWTLWSGTVGLSATLTLPGAEEGKEFDYFRQRCGFPKPTLKPLILPSPFDLQEQCMVFVPASGTDYDCPAEKAPELFLKKRIGLAGSMIQAFGGRTLALHTATGRLAAAAAVLKPLFPGQLLAQGDGDNDALADEFVRDPEKSLLGTRSFFQGFDAPGETLSCEILEKLPFRRRDDPVQEEQCRRAGEKWFDTVVLPAMLMELRQAFGRLIRSKDDHGIFILTDHRTLVKSYGQAVEQALGGVPVRQFTGPADLLKQIPEGSLPFDLKDISGFEERFQEEWDRFRETALFRRVTGLPSLTDIQNKLKIDKLYDWQKTVIDNVLNGVPAQFLIQPAGSGKSLTYQIPALMRPGLTLVVSPLKALMYDQVMSLRKRGICGAAFYNSDLSYEERSEILKRLDRGEIRLLYVAPERLHCNFISKVLNLKQGLSMLVIDEAHMISEAGSQWRPFYGELKHAWEQFGRPQLLAVTATAGKIIKEDIQNQFEIPDEYVFERSVVRERVKISVNQTYGNVTRQIDFAKCFVKQANASPVLIYCSEKEYVHSLYFRLGEPNNFGKYYTGPYNGKTIDPAELSQTHRHFLNDSIRGLIATNAYGMGIDKSNIWGVLFNNMPASLEELVQGWGRVCRDTKQLRQYEADHHPPEISITFNQKDFEEQLKWKIEDPFRDLKKAAGYVLAIMYLQTQESQQMDFSMPCESHSAPDTLDRDTLGACILIARFMRNQGILKSSSFDWCSSAFRFSGFSRIPNSDEIRNFIEKEEDKRKKQFEAVRKFCQDKGCRNEFLQIYFSGTAPSRKCGYCDHCGYDLKAHLAYVREVQGATANNVSKFERGVFSGDNAAFLQYLRGIREDELSARIAYLDREHRESGLEHSDAELAARLLEMKQNKDNAAFAVKTFADLMSKDFARLKGTGRDDILFPFAGDCGIVEPQTLWQMLDKLRAFVRQHQDSLVPSRVTYEFLYDCAPWQQKFSKIKDEKQRGALANWLGETSSILRDMLIDSDWRETLYFIRLERGWKPILKTIQTEESEETEEDWRTFAKYLRHIDRWKQNDAEKYRYLNELIQTFSGPEKEEWERILAAPADYLKLAEAEPECFGPDTPPWEPQWFCESSLVRSQLLRCRNNKENIVLKEIEDAAGEMPIRSWHDLLERMPHTVKLYPEWHEMLKKLEEADQHPPFDKPLPGNLEARRQKLPASLKVFLRSKEITFSDIPSTCSPSKKKQKQVFKDFSQMNSDLFPRDR